MIRLVCEQSSDIKLITNKHNKRRGNRNVSQCDQLVYSVADNPLALQSKVVHSLVIFLEILH